MPIHSGCPCRSAAVQARHPLLKWPSPSLPPHSVAICTAVSSRSTKTGFLENKTLKSRRVLVFLQLRSSYLREPSLSQSVWTLLYLSVVVRAQHQLRHPTMHQVRATKLLLKSCHPVKMAFPLSAGFLQEARLTYPPHATAPIPFPKDFVWWCQSFRDVSHPWAQAARRRRAVPQHASKSVGYT